MDIKCSVGQNGINLGSDTRNIQTLFNTARGCNIALASEVDADLAVDGACGPRTIAAIFGFQKAVLKWSPASCDGRVDPGGRTLREMNGNISSVSNIPVQPTTPDLWVPTYVPSSEPPIPVPAILPRLPSAPPPAPTYESFRQGDYSGVKMGTGNLTISGYGCALCTLTMGATAVGARTEHWPAGLQPQHLTPPLANSIIQKAGAFGGNSGSSIVMESGAAALGMNYEEFGRYSDLLDSDLDRISSHVQANKPVAAHVDYKDGASGDHWILINKKLAGNEYTALDPATGGTCHLRKPLEATENVRMQSRGANDKHGILVGWPANSGTGNQQRYIVVRFALLSTKTSSL